MPNPLPQSFNGGPSLSEKMDSQVLFASIGANEEEIEKVLCDLHITIMW